MGPTLGRGADQLRLVSSCGPGWRPGRSTRARAQPDACILLSESDKNSVRAERQVQIQIISAS